MQNKVIAASSYHAGRWENKCMNIICEQPVTLTVNNEPWLVFMCTPMELESLAIGFLFNEAIIETMEEVASVRVCAGGDNIDVWLHKAVKKPEGWIRTSGCSGGKTSIPANGISIEENSRQNGYVLPVEKVGWMMDQLFRSQDLYRESGGVHTSALSDGESIILVAEDVGRHNTLDKLAGRCLLGQIKLSKPIILTTGRISSEMIQKAGRMGAKVVISHTSPTNMSITMAEKLGITLIGYAHHDRFTAYTHPERILMSASDERIFNEAK